MQSPPPTPSDILAQACPEESDSISQSCDYGPVIKPSGGQEAHHHCLQNENRVKLHTFSCSVSPRTVVPRLHFVRERNFQNGLTLGTKFLFVTEDTQTQTGDGMSAVSMMSSDV